MFLTVVNVLLPYNANFPTKYITLKNITLKDIMIYNKPSCVIKSLVFFFKSNALQLILLHCKLQFYKVEMIFVARNQGFCSVLL